MRHLLALCTGLFLSIILLGGCAAGPQYWTYRQGQAPDHVIHPDIIPMWIDSSFTPSQMEEIKAAAAEWNGVFNGQIVIMVQQHRQLGVDKKYHWYPETFTSWEAGQKLVKTAENTNLGWVIFNMSSGDKNIPTDVPDTALAWVEGIGQHSVFVVTNRLATRSLKDIMMHEMAHLLGAQHVNAPSLEFPYYSNKQVSCIDKITVLQVATVQRLDFNSLNYCITPNEE